MRAMPNKTNSWQLFNAIASRYDMLNRLLSGGQDIYWRNTLISQIPNRPNQSLLDIGTGTGDIALAILKKKKPFIASAIGLDPSRGMLDIAITKTPPGTPITWVEGSATQLPYSNDQFHLITAAFSIRNIEDYPTALSEIVRVLTPKGLCLILEFSLPKSTLFKAVYLVYFRYILPLIGRLISGHKTAYSYLNKTVETFPYGSAFCDKLSAAGLHSVTAIPLTFGIATLYIGHKP